MLTGHCNFTRVMAGECTFKCCLQRTVVTTGGPCGQPTVMATPWYTLFHPNPHPQLSTSRCLRGKGMLFLVGCLTSQQHASLYQGRTYSDSCTCCHTEIEVADQACYITQSQNTDTGPTSPSADPITPGTWQNSLWRASFSVRGMTRSGKTSTGKAAIEPRSAALDCYLRTEPLRAPGGESVQASSRQSALSRGCGFDGLTRWTLVDSQRGPVGRLGHGLKASSSK